MALERPELYVPLGVNFATGGTGTALKRRFGLEGLAVWAAMLAAAKLSKPEGTVTFLHGEHWAAIGLGDCPPSFALEEFLKALSDHKQIRKRRQTDALHVAISQWGAWNQMRNSYLSAQRSARYRARKRGYPQRDGTVTRHVTHRDAEENREELSTTSVSGESSSPPYTDDQDALGLEGRAPDSSPWDEPLEPDPEGQARVREIMRQAALRSVDDREADATIDEEDPEVQRRRAASLAILESLGGGRADTG